jgi:hypothetical protein
VNFVLLPIFYPNILVIITTRTPKNGWSFLSHPDFPNFNMTLCDITGTQWKSWGKQGKILG